MSSHHAKIEWTPRSQVSDGWSKRRAPSIAEQAAYAALRAQARRSAAREVKLGARHFALCPSLLDNIEVGLSRLTPKAMSRRVKHLLIEEVEMPRRFWVGSLTPAIGLKAAMIYSRWCRAVEHAHLAARL